MESLRPKNLEEFVGHEKTKERIEINLEFCLAENQPFPHLLLSSPAGCGKTSLALIISRKMGTDVIPLNAAIIQSPKELLRHFVNLTRNTVVFIDEVHALNKKTEESLYSVMEDFHIRIIGKERTVEKKIHPFTLIGATTQAGLLSKPFHDRFEIQESLLEYSTEDITKIIQLNAGKLNFNMDQQSSEYVARCSRGIPRICINLLKFVHKYCVVKKVGGLEATKEAVKLKGISKTGLTERDRIYLEALCRNSGQASLGTLSKTASIDRHTIEHVIEPYLIKLGLIGIETRGRYINSKRFEELAKAENWKRITVDGESLK